MHEPAILASPSFGNSFAQCKAQIPADVASVPAAVLAQLAEVADQVPSELLLLPVIHRSSHHFRTGKRPPHEGIVVTGARIGLQPMGW
jgi:hypothetical protein